jgi:hypothetical protein
MSFYTSGIHCKQLNPTSNSTNFRTEFKFPVSEEEVYLTDIRLCNIGRTTNAAADINSMAGCGSMIRNIFLYDGNVVLDSLLNFHIYAGFKGFNSTNNDSIDKDHFLLKNNLGLSTDGRDDGEATSVMRDKNFTNQSTNNEDTTSKAWISLKDWLAFLDESMYLPTKIYKGLRLVVEYNNKLTDIYPNTQPASSSTLTPFLIVNQLTNPQAQEMANKQYNGVVFRPLEHSSVQVDALEPTLANPNIEQSQNYTLNSFNNKTLNRLLMVKEPLRPQGNLSNVFGAICSEAQYKEENQVIVNGRNLLPEEGITSENQARAMLFDLWGDCVDVAGASWLPDAANMVSGAINHLGYRDYRSVMVENFIQNLQVSFKRVGQYNAAAGDQTQYKSNGKLRLHFFGEVSKALMVNPDGTYSIRYV